MSLTFRISCASTGGHELAVTSWYETTGHRWPITIEESTEGEAAGYLQKVNKVYKESDEDILAYLHSDTLVHEKDWDKRVLAEFESDPNIALVSFFGAKELGHRDIYKLPYSYTQLARHDCWSYMTNGQVHGSLTNSCMDVAMIDSFSLIVRRTFLDKIGGWPMHCPPSHGNDMYLCMMAARHRQRVRLVGINCSHTGGGTRGNGKFNYPEWAKTTKWGSDSAMHAWWHEYLANEFRDVLPILIR